MNGHMRFVFASANQKNYKNLERSIVLWCRIGISFIEPGLGLASSRVGELA